MHDFIYGVKRMTCAVLQLLIANSALLFLALETFKRPRYLRLQVLFESEARCTMGCSGWPRCVPVAKRAHVLFYVGTVVAITSPDARVTTIITATCAGVCRIAFKARRYPTLADLRPASMTLSAMECAALTNYLGVGAVFAHLCQQS